MTVGADPPEKAPIGDTRQGKGPFWVYNGRDMDWGGTFREGMTVYGYVGFIGPDKLHLLGTAMRLRRQIQWVCCIATLLCALGFGLSIAFDGFGSFLFFIMAGATAGFGALWSWWVTIGDRPFVIDEYRVLVGGTWRAQLECVAAYRFNASGAPI